MAEKEKDTKKKNKTLAERTSFFEWTVAAVGLILVMFSIGFVSYEAIYSKDTPPNLAVKNTSTKKLTDGYLVEFTVKNTGERTAANVIIEGKLSNGETKTITMDYVAAKSEQKGGLFFKENPQANNLEINTIGYVNP
ncbi:MAG: hypothetical protein ACR2J3_02595 [Aridibacter sp.]